MENKIAKLRARKARARSIIVNKMGSFIREKISRGLYWSLLTLDANTPFKWYKIKVYSLLHPQLAQAAAYPGHGFWAVLVLAEAYLGRESVRINVLKRFPRLERLLRMHLFLLL